MYNGILKKGDIVFLEKAPFYRGEITQIAMDGESALLKCVDFGKELDYRDWKIQRKQTGINKRCWGSDGTSGEITLEVAVLKAKVTLKTVVISGEKTQQILSAISQQANAVKIFQEWGFGEIFEKGIAVTLLFWGIPGTGKTLTAQAIADELKMELKIYQTADIETSEPGGAERAIRQIFQDSRGKKTIILFDECDSLLMDRNEVGPILGAQVNALLTEIERYDGVIVFTTNRMGKLDPALERRITTKVEFPFPNREARIAIWKRMIPKKCPLNADVDYEKLADYPLTGGNIKNAVLNAARSAAYAEAKELKLEDFVKAIEKELESIQSFAAEYEKQIHQHNVTHDIQRTATGTTIEKEAKIEMKKEEAMEKIEGTIDKIADEGKADLLEELKKKG